MGNDALGFEAGPVFETFTQPFAFPCKVVELLTQAPGEAGEDVIDFGRGGRGCEGAVDEIPSFTGPVFIWTGSEGCRSAGLESGNEEGLECWSDDRRGFIEDGGSSRVEL